MAWTDPTTAAVRQVLTAARWNTEVRDDLKYLKGQAGNVVIENTMTVGPTSAGASSSIRIGGNASGNRYAYFDLSGDDTYGDGLRVIRDNGGPNTTSRVVHRGTGNFEFQTIEAADILFRTNASYRGGVTAVGNWGFGTTSPQTKIHGYDSSSGAGCGFWGYNGLSTTVQVYPIGTVAGALTAVYTVIPNTGSTTAGVATGVGSIGIIPGASAQIYSSSPDFVNISVSAAGAVSVGRTGGSKTYKVALWFVWI